MTEFEFVVMVIGLRPETNLLDNHLRSIGLSFLGFLLELVAVFLVVQHLTYRGDGRRTDFYQVQFLLLGDAHGILDGIDAHFDVITHQTDFLHATNLFVDAMLVLSVIVIIGTLVAVLGTRTGSWFGAIATISVRSKCH